MFAVDFSRENSVDDTDSNLKSPVEQHVLIAVQSNVSVQPINDMDTDLENIELVGTKDTEAVDGPSCAASICSGGRDDDQSSVCSDVSHTSEKVG